MNIQRYRVIPFKYFFLYLPLANAKAVTRTKHALILRLNYQVYRITRCEGPAGEHIYEGVKEEVGHRYALHFGIDSMRGAVCQRIVFPFKMYNVQHVWNTCRCGLMLKV